mmetsp:Transcript_34071/g.73747  ORF Transcript_34071/g.73747 Transcript_34071/m.73747 type:complete len:336 (-) Transcript_34071:340-1347(-)
MLLLARVPAQHVRYQAQSHRLDRHEHLVDDGKDDVLVTNRQISLSRDVLINHRLIGRDRHQRGTQQAQPIADVPNSHSEGGEGDDVHKEDVDQNVVEIVVTFALQMEHSLRQGSLRPVFALLICIADVGGARAEHLILHLPLFMDRRDVSPSFNAHELEILDFLLCSDSDPTDLPVQWEHLQLQRFLKHRVVAPAELHETTFLLVAPQQVHHGLLRLSFRSHEVQKGVGRKEINLPVRLLHEDIFRPPKNHCRLVPLTLLLNKEEISISVLPPHDALHLLQGVHRFDRVIFGPVSSDLRLEAMQLGILPVHLHDKDKFKLFLFITHFLQFVWSDI